MNIRENLEKLESIGNCYNGKLRDGSTGTYWMDTRAGVIYEYTTDDAEMLVCDMSDADIADIKKYES